MARGNNFYNAGTDVIQAYLHGRRIKDTKEAQIAEEEIKRQQAELRAQEIQEAAHRFQTKLDQDRTIAEAKLDLDKQRVKNQAKILGIQGLRAIMSGNLENVDGSPIDVPRILGGDLSKLIIPTPETKAAREVEQVAAKEKAVQTVRIPFEREKALLAGEVAANRQERLFNFQREQKQLDRNAAHENALLRVQAVRANKDATIADKRAVEDEAVDVHLASVLDGSSTLEEIHKLGQVGVKTITKAKANGIRPINNKERDNLIALKSLERFYDKAKELNTLLKQGNLADQATSAKISDLRDRIEVDLTGFARMVGEKGVISDKDIVRMRGSLPVLLPGGLRSVFDSKGRAKSNDERVRDIEKLYFEKQQGIMKGVSPAQAEALRNRFELLGREEKIED